MGGDGEIGKAQHGVDRREADGRHRQDGAGHQAVDEELRDLARAGQHRASGDLQELELAALDLLVAELAVEDVADLGEVAGAAGALVVDLLALGQELQPVDGAVDLGAGALRDLADVVPDRRAGGLALGLGDGQRDQADVVVALAGVGIGSLDAEALARRS